jgi:transcriptional regulator with XRE-family HTH domain
LSKSRIAKTIKKIRLENNLSVKDFAAKISKSPATVSQWENGKSIPNRRSIIQIEKCFEITSLKDSGSLEVLEKLNEINELSKYFHSLDIFLKDLKNIDDNSIDLAIKSLDIISSKVKNIKKIKEYWIE